MSHNTVFRDMKFHPSRNVVFTLSPLGGHIEALFSPMSYLVKVFEKVTMLLSGD